MKTIVTGGAGFIGSHLVEELIAAGYEVIILDNLSTGRLENISSVYNKILFAEVDIADFEAIEGYFNGVDYVFHLAALADIVPSIKNPLSYHRSNVDGTLSVLEASRKHNIKKIVYTASSSCYGIADILPTPEDAPIKTEYPYAFTKYVGEQYLFAWAKIYGLDAISLRLFNVYGPRSRTSGAYGAVFGVFLAQKLANKKFTVIGNGEQQRDFVFVKDVARAFRMSAESDISNEVFNVGSGNSCSINKLVKLLGGEKEFIPKRPGEPDVTHADISKISRILGWKARVSFEEGVNIMLQNIDYWKKAPVWTAASIAGQTKDWFKYLSK